MRPGIQIPQKLATKLYWEFGAEPTAFARLAEKAVREAVRVAPADARTFIQESSSFDDGLISTTTAGHAPGVPYSDSEWAARRAEISQIFAEAVRRRSPVVESTSSPASAPLFLGPDFDRRLRARVAESLGTSAPAAAPAPTTPSAPFVVVSRTVEEDREYRWAHRGDRWAGLNLSPIQDVPGD